MYVVDDKEDILGGPSIEQSDDCCYAFAAATFTLAAATASVTAAQYSAMDKQNRRVATAAKDSTTTAAAATASVATASVTAASVATASVTAATASSQPNKRRGRPKQTVDEAKESRILTLQKKKEREAANRKELKQKGGAPYEDAKNKDALRKRPAPFQSVDQKAADQGDADAQFFLGVAYQDGEGVEQSDKEAVRWYRQAADQGKADAHFCLGVLASEHPQNTAIFEGVQMVMKPCQVLKETPGAPIHGQKSPGGLREVPERPTDSPRSRSF